MRVETAGSRYGVTAGRAAVALVLVGVAVLVCAARAAADPFVQQGPKIVAAGEVGAAEWGSSVALSGDGDTALIGTNQDDNFQGAVWPYVRTSSGWVQQGPKLTPSDGLAQPDFGVAVDLSTDGNSAVIGGSYDNDGSGAVWFFSRSGSTWTQDGPKFTESGSQGFGYRVAISGDGNTALVTENGNVPGEIVVYGRSGSTWSQQGIIASPDPGLYPYFGSTISLSRDGDTAVVTAAWGSVIVYTRSGSTWTQGPTLPLPSDGTGIVTFGGATAVSADGSTILVEGAQSSLTTGGVWAYAKSGSTWVQQGPELADVPGRIALSDDGNTALIGTGTSGDTLGPALVYTRSGSVWTEQAPIPEPTEVLSPFYGFGFGLSGDGATAFVTDPYDDNEVGAAWAFSTISAPAVTGQPAGATVTAPATASFTVACSGSPTPTIQWQVSTDGGATWTDDTSDAGATAATLTVSVAAAGTAEYRAVCSNSSGSATSAAATLTATTLLPPAVLVGGVLPHQGSAFSLVLISGKGFSRVNEVDFGPGHKALFLRITNSLIVAVAPPRAAGTVDVTVRTTQATSATSSADRFTYLG